MEKEKYLNVVKMAQKNPTKTILYPKENWSYVSIQNHGYYGSKKIFRFYVETVS